MRVCLPDAACKAAAAGRQLSAHACRGQERGRAGPAPAAFACRASCMRRAHGGTKRLLRRALGARPIPASIPGGGGELIVSRDSLDDQRQKPLGGLHAQSCRRLPARPARGRFFFGRATAGPSPSPLFALARHAGALTAPPPLPRPHRTRGMAVRRPRPFRKRRARRGICSQMRELWPSFRAAASSRAAARPADSWRQQISHPIKFLPALLHASSTPYPPAAGSRTFPLFVVTHSIRRR